MVPKMSPNLAAPPLRTDQMKVHSPDHLSLTRCLSHLPGTADIAKGAGANLASVV